MEPSSLSGGCDPSSKHRRSQHGSSAAQASRSRSYGGQDGRAERLDGSASALSEKARRRRPKRKQKATSTGKGKGGPKSKPKPKPPTSLSKLERDTIRACAKTVAEHGPRMEDRIRSGKDASMDNGVWTFLREESVARAYYHELLLWHQENAQAELARRERMSPTASTSSSF